jgi:hypothetical protein
LAGDAIERPTFGDIDENDNNDKDVDHHHDDDDDDDDIATRPDELLARLPPLSFTSDKTVSINSYRLSK